MFRQQIINNIAKIKNGESSAVLNFNIAALGYNRNNYNDEVDDTDKNELYQEFNDVVLAEETFDNLKHELDVAFGGQCDSSGDESDANEDPSHLFSYVEKRFTEDDISDDIAKIIINEPDEMRERKCEACRRRFMLKESFEQHLKECIELKLLVFITENHQLLVIRKNRTISAHDYVRRTIFSLKKLVKSLALCYKEVTDVLPTSDDVKNLLAKQKTTNDATNDKNINVSKKNNWNNSMDLKILKDGSDIKRNDQKRLEHIVNTFHCENDRNNLFTSVTQPPFSPILPLYDATNGIPPVPLSNKKSSSMASISSITNRIHQSSPLETIAAQCGHCLESFNSLALFEDHNRRFHNITHSTPVTVPSNVRADTPPLLELNRIQLIRSPQPSTIDILNNDERNTLLERLAGKSNNFK